MILCQCDVDDTKFDGQLIQQINRETTLNKAIQENLRPTFNRKQTADNKRLRKLK